MNKVSSLKLGLVFGGIFALIHAVWALMVAAGIAEAYLDWILGLHFMTWEYSINDFDIVNALLLVLVTGVIGFILGSIVALLWNMVHGMSHKR